MSSSATPSQQANSFDHDKSLIESVKRGDLQEVLALLDDGATADYADQNGDAPLSLAVRINRPDILRALLKHQANVDEEEQDGGTALDAASAAGRADMIRLLIEYHADVNHKAEGGHTALMYSAFGAMFKDKPSSILKTLLSDADEAESFISSMGTEHYLVAKILIEAGADVNAWAEDCGLSPLMIAAISGNVDLAKLLLAHGASVRLDDGKIDILEFAQTFDSPAEIEATLSDFDDADEKEAFVNWIHVTASGRQEIVALLRTKQMQEAGNYSSR